jgi:hypothetical protein
MCKHVLEQLNLEALAPDIQQCSDVQDAAFGEATEAANLRLSTGFKLEFVPGGVSLAPRVELWAPSV